MNDREFNESVLPLQDLMYGVALRIGMSREDASDMVQETLVKLWRARSSLEDSATLKAYCLRALRNECISHLRSRREKIPIDDLAATPMPESLPAQYRDSRRRIESVIDSLPEGQRRVLRLSCFGEMEVSEIVEATGYSEANVRQLLSRGRKRLRELKERIL